MNKIHIVTTGSYEDTTTVGIFKNEEIAKTYCDEHNKCLNEVSNIQDNNCYEDPYYYHTYEITDSENIDINKIKALKIIDVLVYKDKENSINEFEFDYSIDIIMTCEYNEDIERFQEISYQGFEDSITLRKIIPHNYEFNEYIEELKQICHSIYEEISNIKNNLNIVDDNEISKILNKK